jgi:hypothetical protein
MWVELAIETEELILAVSPPACGEIVEEELGFHLFAT